MKQVKWGVLSTAGIGQEQLIPAIQRSGNGEVIAIASRGDKAKEVAKELNIPKAYTSYEQLLEDPEIEAVYIPLPNSLHKEWVIKAAEHGKHVLCEKPAALNGAELKEMIDVCEHHQVQFMEAFMYQFHPQHEKVKQLIQSGVIGEVASMRGAFSYFLGDPETNIRMSSDLGGGALYDIGSYATHSIRYIMDAEPVKVYASAKTDPKYKVDTTVAGVLSFENGVEALFDCSFEATFRNLYEVLGSTGKIEVNSAYRPDTSENGEGVIRVTKDNGEVEEFSVAGDQYKLQVEHFSECVLENKEPSYSNEKITNNMKVIDACFKAIETGNSVRIK
ncbi:gfo/Idh/MocA family oxidoreductase [Aquibacillus halophilus]|uniref:Gfo/Idh/MocA family oxidoreductase n=1 Tax=Aquibacillus halophilus TaxID=930132 RepID=A0A6A8D8M7_9BACI|nr:Gfo/Idh/MocA family oxidoreductase [Aquibacillus halophilus]MRH41954.1 gfo/Idh/MocA family oxidoreductase [Aquibacillus halophilus]